MPRHPEGIRVYGDVKRAFVVQLPNTTAAEFNALTEAEQGQRVAEALGLRRYGAEEAVQIDGVETPE